MRNKSFHFLLELLIVIVMFTICSIVFVMLFASASQMNEEANMKYEASLRVNSIVEEIRMRGGKQQEYTYEQYVIDVEKNENTYVVTAKDTKENVLEVVKVKYISE